MMVCKGCGFDETPNDYCDACMREAEESHMEDLAEQEELRKLEGEQKSKEKLT